MVKKDGSWETVISDLLDNPLEVEQIALGELEVHDYLLCLTFSEGDLESYRGLGLLVVHLEGVEIAHFDLDQGKGTSYWLSWMEAQLYSQFSSPMYSLSSSPSCSLWVCMNYLRMLATQAGSALLTEISSKEYSSIFLNFRSISFSLLQIRMNSLSSFSSLSRLLQPWLWMFEVLFCFCSSFSALFFSKIASIFAFRSVNYSTISACEHTLPLIHGCLAISVMVGRQLGIQANIFWMRSLKGSEKKPGLRFLLCAFQKMSNLFSLMSLQQGSLATAFSNGGLPAYMMNIMTPLAKMSVFLPSQCFIGIYGAMYPSVPSFVCKIPVPSCPLIKQENPKSAILRMKLELSSIFQGLMSRCAYPFSCMQWMPFII